MQLNAISLNLLRAFEASARHLSFTRAGDELSVTQAAVSHQVKALEERLGVSLFRRTTRGLVLSDEGARLAPIISDAFLRIERALGAVAGGEAREILTISAVGTFAVGFLMERLLDFRAKHPLIDVRLLTNNNKVDLWTEGLDYAIRFGHGSWHGVDAIKLLDAPIAPLCGPEMAQRLRSPADLAQMILLRSYRPQDWPAWLALAGVSSVVAKGPMFDASTLMVQAALLGEGVALAPPSMFLRELREGRLVQPFAIEIGVGAYWLSRLQSKQPTHAMSAFRDWLIDRCATDLGTPNSSRLPWDASDALRRKGCAKSGFEGRGLD